MADYELLETLPDGTERRRYPNGSIRDQNGRMLERPDYLPVITSDTAYLLHRKRKEKYLQAIEAAVTHVTSANTPAEAAGYIVAKRAKVAMSDDGRAGNEAAKIVLAAMDALQDKRQETTHTERREYTVDAETLRIVERMAAMRSGEDIDAEIIE